MTFLLISTTCSHSRHLSLFLLHVPSLFTCSHSHCLYPKIIWYAYPTHVPNPYLYPFPIHFHNSTAHIPTARVLTSSLYPFTWLVNLVTSCTHKLNLYPFPPPVQIPPQRKTFQPPVPITQPVPIQPVPKPYPCTCAHSYHLYLYWIPVPLPNTCTHTYHLYPISSAFPIYTACAVPIPSCVTMHKTSTYT